MIINININERPRRNVKPIIRLINEYNKYTTGKYHGRRDLYDRGYDGCKYIIHKSKTNINI